MKFIHKTKGDVSPSGKNPVYIHAMEEDNKLRDKVARLLFMMNNGHTYAVWYNDEPERLYDERKELDYIGASVFIPVVTERYLSWCNRIGGKKLKAFFEELAEKGTAILPVFSDPEHIVALNKLVGDWHGIPLDSKLTIGLFSNQINRFIPDSELYEAVEKKAFNGKLFLSYRKKDREEALKVMKAIHNAPSACAVAIWFDDFLVAGRDFNDQIEDKIKESDAMALVVTPNLLEKGNYVQRLEYPKAHDKFNKRVLPVEAVKTDRGGLSSLYDGIKNISDLDDIDALDQVMRQSGFAPPSVSRDRDYLLGMAFYLGIHVEKDMERALKLLEGSAKHGCVDALEQMAFFYIAGIGVKRDHDKAIDYKNEARKILVSQIDKQPVESIQRLYKLLYGVDGLSLLLRSRDRCVDARSADGQFLSCMEKISPSKLKEYDLYRAQALSFLSDIHFDKNPSSQMIENALKHAQEGIEIIETSKNKYDNEMQFVYAQLLAGQADCYKAQGKASQAERCYKSASEKAISVYRSANAIEYLSLFVGVIISLGMLLREQGYAEMMAHPSQSINAMQPARSYLSNAVVKGRELVSVHPTINHRESLAIALLDLALVTPEKKQAVEYLEEALKIAKELVDETGDGSLEPLRSEIARVLRKRKGSILKKIIGVLIALLVILMLLKLFGIVDFEPWLRQLFGMQ